MEHGTTTTEVKSPYDMTYKEMLAERHNAFLESDINGLRVLREAALQRSGDAATAHDSDTCVMFSDLVLKIDADIERLGGGQDKEESSTSPISSRSYEELETLRAVATHYGDVDVLRRILEVARSRDGFDDTDPRYGHMVEDCSGTIAEIENEDAAMEALKEHI